MSLYVLDTDILSLYQRGHPAVSQRCRACAPDELAITVISIEEQLSGWYSLLRRARKPDRLAEVYRHLAGQVRFLANWNILEYDEPAIKRYDRLSALKLNVKKMDLWIAAVVLERGGTLITRNTRDFGRIPGLTLEDWTL
jgi:tRNA(fMet)-specific endonuclease VapC